MTYDLAFPMQLATALLPDILLLTGATILMLVAAWKPESLAHQRTVGVGSLVVLAVTLAATIKYALAGASAAPGVIAADSLRWTVDIVVLLAAMGTVALAIEYNERHGIAHGEMHVLVLFATAGMMVLAAARDLMTFFIGLEIMSVAVYVLAGMNRRSGKAAEASLKYFLLGAFATGFLLYGMALIYGATGQTQLTEISRIVLRYTLGDHPMLLVGVGLLSIGLFFKVAAVPFHTWAPDVYEGAPTPITAFMAAAVKAAVFAGFARIWYESLYLVKVWPTVFAWVAIASMIVGNVMALRQQSVKRMLAYSSVAHTGYLLVTLLALSSAGSAALVFYLFAYTLATFGAFAVVTILQDGSERAVTTADFAGLWQTRPVLAVGMTVYLLSLLGFPVFGGLGFFAKWYLLGAALASNVGLQVVVVILVLTSLVSAGYYLQIVRAMFMQERGEQALAPQSAGVLTRVVLAGAAAAILALGIFPGPVAKWATGNAGVKPLEADVLSDVNAQGQPR
ncbi:NADH-quinone oxidoreductase subunit N [Pseudogemmatithrix spongiicola]|uniref:NADH-quinone oxidoreductase subunit N n=1 Tax=Pseudogemmatithrix spongiicola TaxID=3062599 RepID=A0AA49JZY1_9BACT|nr:NADH-quinone oxidoreductase subunit N [Gemmatimonadaceae bacterium 'strain 138']WKW15121.1 NADH-quinone oxidoreductase subunit N [Gemmatimonadaceae bacterium 'strain 318']